MLSGHYTRFGLLVKSYGLPPCINKARLAPHKMVGGTNEQSIEKQQRLHYTLPRGLRAPLASSAHSVVLTKFSVYLAERSQLFLLDSLQLCLVARPLPIVRM